MFNGYVGVGLYYRHLHTCQLRTVQYAISEVLCFFARQFVSFVVLSLLPGWVRCSLQVLTHTPVPPAPASVCANMLMLLILGQRLCATQHSFCDVCPLMHRC